MGIKLSSGMFVPHGGDAGAFSFGQDEMSGPGQTRNGARSRGMSVRPAGADIVRLQAQFRFVAFAVFCTAKYSTLFDRPVDDGTAALIRVESPRYRQVRRSTLPRRSSMIGPRWSGSILTKACVGPK